MLAGTRLEAAVHSLLEAMDGLEEVQNLPNSLLGAVADPPAAGVPEHVEHALREVADAAIESGTSWEDLSSMVSSCASAATHKRYPQSNVHETMYSTPPSSPRSPLQDASSRANLLHQPEHEGQYSSFPSKPAKSQPEQQPPQKAEQEIQMQTSKPALRSSLKARVQRLEQKATSTSSASASTSMSSSSDGQDTHDSVGNVRNAWQRVEALSNELQETREQLAAAHSAEAAEREKARRESWKRQRAEQRTQQVEQQLEQERERSKHAQAEASTAREEFDTLRKQLNEEKHRADTAEQARDDALKQARLSNAKLNQANGALDGAKAAMRRALEDKRKAEAALAARRGTPATVPSNAGTGAARKLQQHANAAATSAANNCTSSARQFNSG